MVGFKLKLLEVTDNINTPTKRGRVTIAGHFNHYLAPKTLESIFKQAQLEDMDD